MEYLILGLLILSPMTGYELQQFIKNNLSLICSHSAGSIQTAIAKLKNQGKITCQDTSQGKRIKKVFLITDCGRQAFSDWVAQPMQADKVKNMELSKLFFLGLADKKERLAAFHEALLEGYQARLEGGDHQLLAKMKTVWDYLLPDADRKARKKILKSATLPAYRSAVSALLDR